MAQLMSGDAYYAGDQEQRAQRILDTLESHATAAVIRSRFDERTEAARARHDRVACRRYSALFRKTSQRSNRKRSASSARQENRSTPKSSNASTARGASSCATGTARPKTALSSWPMASTTSSVD